MRFYRRGVGLWRNRVTEQKGVARVGDVSLLPLREKGIDFWLHVLKSAMLREVCLL